jgi:hypothetical protein
VVGRQDCCAVGERRLRLAFGCVAVQPRPGPRVRRLGIGGGSDPTRHAISRVVMALVARVRVIHTIYWALRATVADLGKGVQRGVVGLGEAVEVFLGSDDAGVAEPFLDHLEVGAAGEQP